MSNPAGKLWMLLTLLQTRSNRTVSELAHELQVSPRTVHRYIAMLEEMGIPLYSERGRAGGFSLVRGYRLPPMMFSNAEAVTLALGLDLVTQMWGSLYADAARSAGAKLELVLPAAQLEEVQHSRRTLLTSGLHQVDAETARPQLETIHSAIRAARCLDLTYTDSTGQVTVRRVDPYALVHRWGWWYLLGLCHLRRSIRIFRLDRVSGMVQTAEHFIQPVDFDPETQLEIESTGPRVRLLFDDRSAHLAYQYRSWWDEIIPQPDGRVEVSFFSPDPESTAESILALGRGVSVLSPPELRRQLADLGREIAANNSTT